VKQAAAVFVRRRNGRFRQRRGDVRLKDSGKIDRGDLFDFAVKIKLAPEL